MKAGASKGSDSFNRSLPGGSAEELECWLPLNRQLRPGLAIDVLSDPGSVHVKIELIAPAVVS